jgi:hypothetical protein
MFNAGMVNRESLSAKLPVFWQKNAVWGRFLALKNTVNYNRRSFVNPPGAPQPLGQRPRLRNFFVVIQCVVTRNGALSLLQYVCDNMLQTLGKAAVPGFPPGAPTEMVNVELPDATPHRPRALRAHARALRRRRPYSASFVSCVWPATTWKLAGAAGAGAPCERHRAS